LTNSEMEELLPVIVLAAAATFAASTIMKFLHDSPAAPEKRTAEMREQMQDVRELRRIKEEYLKAQDTELEESPAG